jgi:DNA-binding winged helix-turn-helix (wHTH) protein
MPTPPLVARFGPFSLDVGQFELRRDGRTVKLERQAMELLILLVERRGQLVSRPEIVARLWGDSVFVDVDTGVNTAVSKIRQALRDSAEAPTFIETVQGKGYRFIAPVHEPTLLPDAARPAAAIPSTRPPAAAPAAVESAPPWPHTNRRRRSVRGDGPWRLPHWPSASSVSSRSSDSGQRRFLRTRTHA